MSEVTVDIIQELKTPKTMDELVKKFPRVGRNNLHAEITVLRRKNTVVKIKETYHLTPAYKKQNNI